MNILCLFTRPPGAFATASVLALTLGHSPGFGQAAPAPTVDAPTLARYDRNNDGRLDSTERDAMEADRARATAAPASTASGASQSAAGDKIIELSPFEVAAGSDRGYYASSSLSGTRLNSKLEDLASSISVVTKQQLLDTAAVDINDIFLYELNTEGTGNFTAFSVGRNGDVIDSVQSDPMNANRVRGMDSANIARNGFAGNSRIPIDTYNTDAVEISRGANSNIFGLGSASGTVNIVSAQANLSRSATQFTARGDSYGGYRGTVDINRPLLRDKLAVRFSGVYESKGFMREPSADITRRGQGMITYRPFKNTTLRASYESYHNFARRPNAITPRDTTTYWNAVGRPTWDPTTQRVTINGVQQSTVYPQSQDGNLPPGLMSQGTGFYNRPGFYIDGSNAPFYTVNRAATTQADPGQANSNIRYLESSTDILRLRGSSMPLFTTPGISDQSLYDWESINYVAPNYNKDKADIYSVSLEQFLINSPRQVLAGRLGWYLEDVDNYSRNFISGNASVLFIDVNEKLLDGRPNPYFLRPYLGASEPTIFNRPEVNDNFRGELAYQLDLTREEGRFGWLKWLGKHRAAGYHETRLITSATYRYREQVIDDHPWLSIVNRQSNAEARGYFKYYLGDNNGGNIDHAPPALYGAAGNYNLYWYNGATQQWVNEPVVFGETGVTPTNRTRREIRSRGLTLQSFLFDDRLVTTFGWRRDKNRSRESAGAAVDPATGFVTYDALDTWGQFTEREGPTKTQGVVVKPFRNWGPIDRRAEGGGARGFLFDFVRSLNFHYNESDTFQPARAQYSLFGELLPDPQGRGKDYGLSFSLMQGKFVTRITRYDSKQQFSRGGDAGIVATRANRIDFGSDGFNLEDQATTWVSQLHPDWTPQQQREEVYKIMQLPGGFIEEVSGRSVAETQDVASKGYEIEMNYNPTQFWTVRANLAQQKTIDSNMSPNIQRYFDGRLPIWTNVRVPTDLLPDGTQLANAGNSWWTTSFGSSGTPRAFYEGVVLAPYKLAVANQGKPRSQVREWRFNVSTSYHLAGMFPENKWLKATRVGGSMRWEDQATIGYLGAAPDADGVLRTLDPNRPVFDDARTYFDCFVAHTLRFNQNKYRATVQLNVRNVFEDGRLQAVGVNPDGRPYNFRIIDPRQFILSVTFDL